MDPQVRKNVSLMFAIDDGDHSKVELLLNEGADPNFTDANSTDGLCTPLHVAVDRCDLISVEILLQRGATFDTKVRNFKSPLELAESHPRMSLIFRTYFENNRPSRARSNFNQISDNSSSCDYRRRPGSAGIAGQYYEIRLMALILLRLRRLDCKFYLGSNVDGIGDFDDLVVRYRCPNSDRDSLLFVQAKHREDPDKNKIKFAAIKDTSCDRGVFSVHTNFKNYLKIREQFARRPGEFFKGKFEDLDVKLILYTPAKYEYTLLQKVNKFDLLKTNEDGRILLVESDDQIITNLCKYSDKDLVENILKVENKFREEIFLNDLAKDFLSKFRIYCTQAKEDQVWSILKQEYSDYNGNWEPIMYHDYIEKYWRKSGAITFLTETKNWFVPDKNEKYLTPQCGTNVPIGGEMTPISRTNFLLLFAIEDKNYTRVEDLLNFDPKADPNFMDANATNGNSTPLHVAVAMGDPKSVRMLLDAGAAFCTRNDRGETAWEMAKRMKCSAVVAVFERHGRRVRKSLENRTNRNPCAIV